MLDGGDFAGRNVRITHDLRRRRHDRRSPDAIRHGNAGQSVDVIVGNIHVVGNIRDIGSIGNLGNAGNIGIDRNVRLRLKQHCGIVEPDNDNVIDHRVEQWCSRRHSAGILRDRKSRSQFGTIGADNKFIALCRHRRIEFGADDAHCRTTGHASHHHCAKHYPVRQFLICERERP